MEEKKYIPILIARIYNSPIKPILYVHRAEEGLKYIRKFAYAANTKCYRKFSVIL